MKLKKKELDNLKALVDKISTKQNEIGLNTINGHKLAHEFSQLEIQLNNMKSNLVRNLDSTRGFHHSTSGRGRACRRVCGRRRRRGCVCA